jgi:hypothetical protein
MDFGRLGVRTLPIIPRLPSLKYGRERKGNTGVEKCYPSPLLE